MTWPRAMATKLAALLEEHGGSIAVAAWHHARARQERAGYADPTPTPTDTLVADARAAGHPVIGD